MIKKYSFIAFILACILSFTFISCKQIGKGLLKQEAKEVTRQEAKDLLKQETKTLGKQSVREEVERESEVAFKQGEKKTSSAVIRATQGISAKDELKNGILTSTKSLKIAANRILIHSKNQYVSLDKYSKWVGKHGNSALKLGWPKKGDVLRENMRKVMGKDYAKFADKTTYQAHHLVCKDSRYPSSLKSQRILEKFGIDINDPMNGILLPDNTESLFKGTIHTGGHTRNYSDYIYSLLKNSKSKGQCFEILDNIKNKLYKGQLALYKSDNNVVNTVKSSFK